MACMKLGSKADVFERRGQDWVCTTGLPSDVTVEVEESFFHLHKFPLLSKSSVLERLIKEKSDNGEEDCIILLPDLPGGAKAFELVAIFCYGAKLEISASNVAFLRCAAEHLDMTEDISEGNLISQTESFLNQAVLQSWNDSLKVLQTCDALLPHAEDLQIVNRCIESLATKACRDAGLLSWPVIKYGPMQSPGGSILWNGISTGARPRDCSSDWWFEDVATLSLPMYKRLISVMESRTKEEIIAGSLTFYAKRYLPGLSRRQINGDTSMKPVLSEEEQRHLLEEIDRLLPLEKGLSPTKLLFGLLRTSMIIGASPSCKSNLERRIGMQLEEATLEDLLMPSFSCSMETLYDIDCVQRILEHFLTMDRANGSMSPCFDDDEQFLGSPCLMPITSVGKLIDGYLAEVAPDSNLKLPKFEALAGAIPDYARPLDDGLYRAIDIYLKAHPWLTESEREQLCHLMDCQKLSLEACTHAAQNERLPLRVVVQVLFFEQLQLRSSIAGCFLFSDNLDGGSKTLLNGGPAVAPGEAAIRENQVLKVGMDSMRWRVAELEKECSSMREEIDKLGKGGGKSRGGTWEKLQKKLGIKIKSQMCSAEVESVRKRKDDITKVEKWKANLIAKQQQQQLRIEE